MTIHIFGNEHFKSNENDALLWSQTDEFGNAVARGKTLNTELFEGPMKDTNANNREVWLHDPGLMIAGIYGNMAEH